MLHVLDDASGSADALAQRTRALRKSLTMQDCVELTIANSIWVRADVPFDPAFLENARSVHDATAEHLDPEHAAAALNAWASENTKGRITHVASDPVMETFLLMNAVYFKGMWASPFDPTATKLLPVPDGIGCIP